MICIISLFCFDVFLLNVIVSMFVLMLSLMNISTRVCFEALPYEFTYVQLRVCFDAFPYEYIN